MKLKPSNFLQRKMYVSIIWVFVLTLFFLNLSITTPFFWDEAWSYMRTIDWMLHNHITINPSIMDPEISRAHPLGFYAFISLFAKIFGSSNTFFHLFMAMVNGFFLLILTREIGKDKSVMHGLLLLIIFLIQEVIIVQFPFVLPEIIIGILSVLAILYFHQKRFALFILTSLSVVLIKESSIVLLLSLWVYFIFEFIFIKKSWKPFFALIIPSGIFMLHFLIVKQAFGWYFYPVHAQFLHNPSMSVWLTGLNMIKQFVFLEQGRAIFTYLLILGIGILLIKRIMARRKWETVELKKYVQSIYFPLFVFFITYICFSAANFIMTRYLIPLILVFIIGFIGFVLECFKSNYIKGLFFCISICYVGYHNYNGTDSWIDDCKFNSKQMITTHTEAIHYLEKNFNKETSISTHFLLQTYLTKKYAGYLVNQPFINVDISDSTFSDDLIIISSTEYNEYIIDHLQNGKQQDYFLLKRFSHPPAWCEIYKRR